MFGFINWFRRSPASVSADELSEEYRALLQTLESIVAVLQEDEEQHWVDYMTEVRSIILRGDHRGVKKLLGAYGGMGSFNDLVLGQRMVNDAPVTREDMAALNDRLDALRTRAWTQAKGLSVTR